MRFIGEDHRERRIIFYGGDHDPSGMNITESIRKTLFEFGADVEVVRITLTDEQIHKYDLPPCFAKKTDTRFKNYAKEHGVLAWEMDALPPNVLTQLFVDEIESITDTSLYNELAEYEAEGRAHLLEIARNQS